MGLLENAKEVLVVANYIDHAIAWSADSFDKWFGNRTVHLHSILRRIYASFNLGHIGVLPR